jgi:hypothetical protein
MPALPTVFAPVVGCSMQLHVSHTPLAAYVAAPIWLDALRALPNWEGALHILPPGVFLHPSTQ